MNHNILNIIRNTKLLIESEGNGSIIASDNDNYNTFVSDINSLVSSVSISYEDMQYFKDIKRVSWGGKIAGEISWSALYSEDEQDKFFISSDSVAISTEISLAIHKLNLYIHEKWYNTIRTLIARNEL